MSTRLPFTRKTPFLDFRILPKKLFQVGVLVVSSLIFRYVSLGTMIGVFPEPRIYHQTKPPQNSQCELIPPFGTKEQDQIIRV
eukprot:2166665-Amphidinium_carterae.1